MDKVKPGWDLSTRGPSAVEGLHRAFAGRSWMPLVVPPSLANDMVMAESGLAWTTDPTAASPYAANSLWEGDQPPSQLLISLYDRRTPFLFFGQDSNGYATSTMLISRFGNSCIVMQPGGVDGLLKAVLVLGRVLGDSPTSLPTGELNYWLWGRGGSVQLARRVDAEGGAELFPEFGDSRWEMRIDDEPYYGPGPVSPSFAISETWTRMLAEVSASGEQELERLLQVAGTFVHHEPHIAAEVPHEDPPATPAAPVGGGTDGGEEVAEEVETFVGRDPLGNEQLVQLAAWRCFSELHRRHSKSVSLTFEHYPTGAGMLGAVRTDGTRRTLLNYMGSLHAWDRSERDHVWTRKGDAWGVIFSLGLQSAIEMLEDALGLPHRETPDPATSETLATRLIAALLARSAYSAKVWWAIPAFELGRSNSLYRIADDAGMVGALSTPAGAVSLWQVTNHVEVAALISIDGRAVSNNTEGAIDLLEAYRKCGKDIQGVVTQVFGAV